MKKEGRKRLSEWINTKRNTLQEKAMWKIVTKNEEKLTDAKKLKVGGRKRQNMN